MMFKINLSTLGIIETVDQPPKVLLSPGVPLDKQMAALADLSWVDDSLAEYSGFGYWPVVDVTIIPDGKRLAATFTDTPNAATKKVDRVYDLEDIPVAPMTVSPDRFIALFPAAKAKAILKSDNAAVVQWVAMLQSRREPIDLGSPGLAAKLQELVALGLISAEDKANIVAGLAPA